MKRLWTSLALIACLMAGTSVQAQSDWGNPSQIGSYQSILSSYAQQAHGIAQPAIQGSQPRGVAPQFAQPYGGGGQFQSVQQPVGGYAVPSGGYAAPVGQALPAAPAIPLQQPAFSQALPVGPAQTVAPSVAAPVLNSPIQTGLSYGAYQPATNLPVIDTGIPCGPQQGFATAPAFQAPAFQAPIFQAPAFSAPAVVSQVAAGPTRNRVVGVRGLAFRRINNGKDKLFGFNSNNDQLFLSSADNRNIGGVEAFYASRGKNGSGFEFRYFGLFPQESSAEIQGISPLYASTNLQGLTNIFHGLAGFNAYDIYNLSVSQRLTRNSDIRGLELNLLRNGGCYQNRRCKRVNFEVLGGFRWFQFDDSLRFDAFLNTPGYPEQLSYAIEAENTLLGPQIGFRTETCVTCKLRFTFGTKFGIFNNRATVRQQIFDETGYNPFIGDSNQQGEFFNFEDQRNSLATLGELDLGLIYQLSCRLRANIGYRAIGVSGVATAQEQIPHDFRDVQEIRSVNSGGNLILSGGYAGLEYSF